MSYITLDILVTPPSEIQYSRVRHEQLHINDHGFDFEATFDPNIEHFHFKSSAVTDFVDEKPTQYRRVIRTHTIKEDTGYLDWYRHRDEYSRMKLDGVDFKVKCVISHEIAAKERTFLRRVTDDNHSVRVMVKTEPARPEHRAVKVEQKPNVQAVLPLAALR